MLAKRLALPTLGTVLASVLLTSSPASVGATPEASDLEVRIEHAEADLTLAGTLSFPEGEGPHPAVLLLTGSGGHVRDQIISGFPMFAELARFLVERGLVVLRLDDRGTGDSTGPTARASTTEERSHDAEAAWRFLTNRPEVDASRSGLLGHSEGTLTAALLASRVPEISFSILLSPFALPGAELWVRQQGDILRREGAMEAEQIARIEAALTAMVEHIGRGGNTDEGFYEHGRAACLAWGDPPEDVRPAFVDEVFGDLRQRWYEYFFATDPSEFLQHLDMPVLAVFGSADLQVPVAENVPRLLRSLLEGGNRDLELLVLPDEDHFFMTGDGLAPNEHETGKMRFSTTMLDALDAWIARRLSESETKAAAR